MDSWLEYLAFLSWQNQKIALEDFQRVFQNQKDIFRPEDITPLVSCPETRSYMQNQPHWWKKALQDRGTTRLLNVKTAWPYHPDYPKKLLNMRKPPPLLSWTGQLKTDGFLFSVVGSRTPYTDTLLWMDRYLSVFLKSQSDLVLMSGGAKGVDQKAHALSLSCEVPTLCFLPCGLKYFYPRDLRKWREPVLKSGGGFVSVFPLASPMRKFHFHVRNEVLAYMSHLIFIVQAALRSGTMVTARFALNAGTTLCTLPFSPLYGGCKGNLSLINDGCFMVRDHMDMEVLYQSCKLTSDLS